MMKKRNLMDELHVMLANALRERQIEMFQGRPPRDLVINKDDLINLQIALNSSKTLEEFLSVV